MNARSLGLLSLLLLSRTLADGEVAGKTVLPEALFPQLETYLQQAINQSPRMISRALDLEIAEQDRIQARAGLLPTASGYINAEQAKDYRADINYAQNERILQYDARLTQPIFHWGERRNNARMGEIRNKIAQGQYQDGYRLLAAELRGKFLNLILSKHIVARYSFNKQFALEQLKLAEDKLAKKIISDSDIFAYRVTADRANIDLERETFNYDNARQAFARFAGLTQIQDEDIPEVIPKLQYQPEVYVDLLAAFQKQKAPPTFEAERVRRNIEIQELNYENQKTRLRPKLSLILGATENQFQYALFSQKYMDRQLYAGLSMSWTVFDGLASRAAVHSALANKRQMENDYKELVGRILQDASASEKQIYFSARNMAISDRYLSDAEGNLKARTEEHKSGLVSDADLKTVKLGLMDTTTNAYAARIEFLTRIGDFLGAVNADPSAANLPVQK